MQNSNPELFSASLDMGIASYLADNPAQQVINIARKTLNAKHNIPCNRSMRLVIKSKEPIKFVRLVCDEIMDNSH